MTFLEAAAKAKAENLTFYRRAWRTGSREKTTRIGLMFGWYERAFVRNPKTGISTKKAIRFKFGEILTSFDSTCFTSTILVLTHEDLMAADYEVKFVTLAGGK